MKRALLELLSAARHIEHCASAEVLNNSTTAKAAMTTKIVCQLRQRI
ncbi:MAG TPA: hypothetical protein VFT02_10295 [Pyrinomonadaceae bacterium]|nr:hypothetical protein [Pyrinomonadaceae bacterium]